MSVQIMHTYRFILHFHIWHTNHVNDDLLWSSHISNCCLIHRRVPAWCCTQLYIYMFPLQYYRNSLWWKYRYQSLPHRYVIRNDVRQHLSSAHILSKRRLDCSMSWLLMHGDKHGIVRVCATQLRLYPNLVLHTYDTGIELKVRYLFFWWVRCCCGGVLHMQHVCFLWALWWNQSINILFYIWVLYMQHVCFLWALLWNQ